MTALELFNQGVDAMEEEDYNAAIDMFDACICSEPPPDMEFLAYCNLSESIKNKYGFGERDIRTVPNAEYKWFQRAGKCLNRAIDVYEQKRPGGPHAGAIDHLYSIAKKTTFYLQGKVMIDETGKLQMRDFDAVARAFAPPLRCLEKE